MGQRQMGTAQKESKAVRYSGIPEKANVRDVGIARRRYYGLTKEELDRMSPAQRAYQDCDAGECPEEPPPENKGS